MNLEKRIRLLEEVLRPDLHALSQAEQERLKELTYSQLDFADPAFPRAEYMKLVGKITSPEHHAETVIKAWEEVKKKFGTSEPK